VGSNPSFTLKLDGKDGPLDPQFKHTRSQSYQTFFLSFPMFAVKLECFVASEKKIVWPCKLSEKTEKTMVQLLKSLIRLTPLFLAILTQSKT